MAEIIYELKNMRPQEVMLDGVRWIDADEYDVFAEHLQICGQRTILKERWLQIHEEGTRYCLLFDDGIPVARACVEKYSETFWEVADVRVARAHRNQGFAQRVCSFVLNYILVCEKTPTIRTEEDNAAMQSVIAKLGFTARKE